MTRDSQIAETRALCADLPAWLQPPVVLSRRKRLAVLGGTGSIGQSTLKVLRHDQVRPLETLSGFGGVGVVGGAGHTLDSNGATDRESNSPVSVNVGLGGACGAGRRFELYGISGHGNLGALAAAVQEFRPPVVVGSDREVARGWSACCPGFTGDFYEGPEGLVRLASDPAVDVVVAGIVGRAGLESTLAAIECGKVVGLANKETLVMAGHLATDLAERTGARLLPVDSEHNAIFQCLLGAGRKQVRRVVLTASGGPFRTWTTAEQASATPQQALAHPTWKMGAKISIDSATMMNKALELIEAKWLFGLEVEQLQVVVHPESIVHSLVEFVDGSVLAQLSPPDMALPIQQVLDFPERVESPAKKMDFLANWSLNFHSPDLDRFPALLLGLEVARRGGSCGVVLNAANEVAVQAFLDGGIGFTQIVPICRRVLDSHPFEAYPDLRSLLDLDRWARQETTQCISKP